MTKHVDEQLVDEAIDAYVDWREECAEVWDAYERWARATTIDAAGAFSAYGAALELEECASDAYADRIARIAGGTDPTGGFVARTIQALTR